MIFLLSLMLLFSEAQLESNHLDGSFGLQTPVMNVSVEKGQISHTELTIERDKGKTAFHFHEEAELPERLTISTTLLSLSIMPDSDHSDLPYDIYERVNQFSLQVDRDIEVISESRSYLPTMSATSLTDQQMLELLNKFEIPLTFDLDEV
ncbi:MAG: hypothetical protein ACNA78_09890, partial [Balneolaceae bacterium]